MKKEKTQTEPTPSPADLRNFVQQVKAASIRLSEEATTLAAGLDGDSERGLKETVLKLDSACDAFWDAVFGAETELRFHKQAWFARNKLSRLVILDCIFFNPDRREFWIKDGGGVWRAHDETSAKCFLIHLGLSPIPQPLLNFRSPVEAVLHSLTFDVQAPPPFNAILLKAQCDNCIFFRDESFGERLRGVCTCPPPESYQWIQYPFRRLKKDMTKAEREQEEKEKVFLVQPGVECNDRCEKFSPCPIEEVPRD